MLGCTPRESFVWLLAFNLEVLHGLLNEHAFNLLAMSYETSPNEAWISVRRIIVAMPLVLIAPEPLRQRILFEFQQLIRYGFVDEAARSYSAASGPIRSLLQTQIEQLDLRHSLFRLIAKTPFLKTFSQTPRGCCVRISSGIKWVAYRHKRKTTCLISPNSLSSCHDASVFSSGRCLFAAAGIIGVLFRPGVGELS
jgi:hypothetical protein